MTARESTNIATYIGKGATVQEAVNRAVAEFEEANNPPSGIVRWISVNAQTFWHEPEQGFYHIITAAWQW